jgi:hypothetical protein
MEHELLETQHTTAGLKELFMSANPNTLDESTGAPRDVSLPNPAHGVVTEKLPRQHPLMPGRYGPWF